MLELAAALGLMLGTWAILRGGFHGPRGFQVAGFDINSAGLGVLAVGAAMWFFGVLYGVALMVAVVIHEFGHVAAFRICGHADARFRLIPLFGGVAISNQQPASVDKAFFITLMGPAIGLAPMALCFALSDLVVLRDTDFAYQVANYLYIQAMVFGSLNFFNLLPLWPLDGGKITQRLVYTFFPGATRITSIAMSVVAVALCVMTRQYLLLLFVLMGWQGLMQSERLLEAQRPMPMRTALLALAAYLATAAAFFAGGANLLSWFF